MEESRHNQKFNGARPQISVVMPTFKQEAFITRALESLVAQTIKAWELIIINDGSPDETEQKIDPFLKDKRIRYFAVPHNLGLGRVLNLGLSEAKGELVAYLPSDDVYYPEHLHSLCDLLRDNPQAILAFSGVQHHGEKESAGQIQGYPLQLVQVMHCACARMWTGRNELVTDDLGVMFWNKIADLGQFLGTGQITCKWVDHLYQRHKIIREPIGGINPYRVYYEVREPLRFKSSTGNLFDEVKLYSNERNRPNTPAAPDGLKILLLGELGKNADRILALEEAGHKLYGLWTANPCGYNTIGPLPFGHVEDLDREKYPEQIKEIKPDVIYGLLNWPAVPIVHEVVKNNPGIPFVWHFKESPFECMKNGTWDMLFDLYTSADGLIYTNPETKNWLATVLPKTALNKPDFILDGDLPKKFWFTKNVSPKLSDGSEESHVVILEAYDLYKHAVDELAERKIQLHYLNNIDCSNWVGELSKYDAGWLNFRRSNNGGGITKVVRDDISIPEHVYAFVAAGLPIIQYDNSDSVVATQSLTKKHHLGIFAKDVKNLCQKLHDRKLLSEISRNSWDAREQFTFDFHAQKLTEFFRKVVRG